MKRLLLLTLAASSHLLAQPARAPQKTALPLLDVESGYLIGGSQNGKWISAKTAAATLRKGASLRVFSATGMLGRGQLAKIETGEAPCPDTFFTAVAPDLTPKKAQFALGGAHNPFPRAVRSESTNQATYRSLVASILKKHGIARPVVQITQIWRVDLEGDGAQEVLLTASRKADNGDANSISPASRAGDYSLLLLRRIVRGKVEDVILAAEFYPRAKKFNAPGFYRLAAVLDADGDGKMEFLVRGAYYEGRWTELYSAQGAKPRAVLTQGCGV